MALAGEAAAGVPDEIVSFPEWRESLGGISSLSEEVKRAYVNDILGLLRACKSERRALSAGFIRWFLRRPGLREEERQAERAAFQWLFKAARAAGKTRLTNREFVEPQAGPIGLAAGDQRRFEAPAGAGLPPLAADDM